MGQSDEKEWKSAVCGALENRVNFFDVANVYGLGREEEILLRHVKAGERHDVVIATKGRAGLGPASQSAS